MLWIDEPHYCRAEVTLEAALSKQQPLNLFWTSELALTSVLRHDASIATPLTSPCPPVSTARTGISTLLITWDSKDVHTGGAERKDAER